MAGKLKICHGTRIRENIGMSFLKVNNEDISSAAELWGRVSSKFTSVQGNAVYNNWLKPLSVSSIDNGFVTLLSPSRFVKDWVVTNYTYALEKIFAEELPNFRSFAIIVKKAAPAHITNAGDAVLKGNEVKTETNQQALDFGDVKQKNKFTDLLANKLDGRFTFENLIFAEGNMLAANAAMKIAENDDCESLSPLFIHGKVGMGKTHILQAVANKALQSKSYAKVLYLSAEKFMFSYVRALKENSLMDFKDYVRSVDLLLIDDIRFICGKQNFQEEFIHTVNSVIDAGGKVILSADRAPNRMDDLDDRIKSRLAGGLIADIKPYSSEDILNILASKAVISKTRVAENIMKMIADNVPESIREAEGILNRIIQTSKLTGKEITMEMAVSILKASCVSVKKEITLEDIKKLICAKFNLTQTEIESATRLKKISEARQIAMYIAKKATTKSFPEIGRFFGGKDHATVIHAVKKIEKMIADNPNFESIIEKLTSSLAV